MIRISENKSAGGQNKAWVILLTIRAIRVIRGSVSALLIIND